MSLTATTLVMTRSPAKRIPMMGYGLVIAGAWSLPRMFGANQIEIYPQRRLRSPTGSGHERARTRRHNISGGIQPRNTRLVPVVAHQESPRVSFNGELIKELDRCMPSRSHKASHSGH